MTQWTQWAHLVNPIYVQRAGFVVTQRPQGLLLVYRVYGQGAQLGCDAMAPGGLGGLSSLRTVGALWYDATAPGGADVA